MAEGIHYKKGIGLKRTNDSIIPIFLGNLRLHPQFESEGMYRPVNLPQYRNRVVEYLKEHTIELYQPKSEDNLEFRLNKQGQDSVDIANRVIILANKVLVTTREGDKRSENFEGKTYNPQDYLNAILGTLNPLGGDDIIKYGDFVSHLMSLDQERNLFPTLAVDGFKMLAKWHSSLSDEINRKKLKRPVEQLNSIYINILDGVVGYSKQIFENTGHYVLDDDGRKKYGNTMMRILGNILEYSEERFRQEEHLDPDKFGKDLIGKIESLHNAEFQSQKIKIRS